MRAKSPHTKAIGMLVVVTLIWGSGFIATEYAIDSQIDFAWIMALRFLLGAMVIAAAFLKKIKATKKKAFVHGVGAGVLLFAAFYTQTIGQANTTVANAAFITASNVVMIPFIVWLLTARRPPFKVFLLSLLTMAGVVLLSIQPGSGLSLGRGDALVLLCAFLFAAHISYLSLLCREDEPISVAFWQLLSAALSGLILLVIQRPASTAAQWQAAAWPIFYLGLFSTGLCYLLQTYAQTFLGASETGIILSLEGLFGTMFSLLLGMDVLRWNMVLVWMMITFSVMCMEIKGKRDTQAP